MAVDWTEVRVRAGQWVCPEHGVVEPWQQVVPACRDCLRDVHLAVRTDNGYIVYQAQDPTHCAGPERHPLGLKQMQRGWASCRCTALGGHHTWTCRACGDQQTWPPHSVVDSQPYSGGL